MKIIDIFCGNLNVIKSTAESKDNRQRNKGTQDDNDYGKFCAVTTPRKVKRSGQVGEDGEDAEEIIGRKEILERVNVESSSRPMEICLKPR